MTPPLPDPSVVVRKETVNVELRHLGAEPVTGDLFVRPLDAEGRAERLVDVLGHRAFLPLKQRDRVTFMATRQIAWVRLALLAAVDELDLDAEDDSTGRGVEVDVAFSDGSSLSGALRYALPAGSRRLGDYLERAPAFFPLRTGDWVYLVNVAHVVSVAPVDEPS